MFADMLNALSEIIIPKRMGTNRLISAAYNENITIIRKCIRDKVDPNQLSEFAPITPLMIAAKNGKSRSVIELIKAGAHPYIYGENKRTALHDTIEMCHLAAFRLFLLSDSNYENIIDKDSICAKVKVDKWPRDVKENIKEVVSRSLKLEKFSEEIKRLRAASGYNFKSIAKCYQHMARLYYKQAKNEIKFKTKSAKFNAKTQININKDKRIYAKYYLENSCQFFQLSKDFYLESNKYLNIKYENLHNALQQLNKEFCRVAEQLADLSRSLHDTESSVKYSALTAKLKYDSVVPYSSLTHYTMIDVLDSNTDDESKLLITKLKFD